MSFQNLIVRIFKSHGFEIDSTSNYNRYILATKDSITLSIGYNEPGTELSMGNLRNFFRAAKRDKADRMIYVMPGALPNSLEHFADERNIQLWDRERLEREIGRTVVTDLESMDKDESLEDIDRFLKPSSEIEPKNYTKTRSGSESASDEMGIMVPTMIFGDDPERSTRTSTKPISSSGSGISGETGDSLFGLNTDFKPLDTDEVTDLNIVKLKVSKDLAATMANKIIKGFRFNLELIPYYVFNYSCSLNISESEPSVASGVLGINGLTSNVEDWEENIETIHNLDEPYTRLDVKFPVDNALSLVKKAVMDRNTKTVETREEFDSTIIFEKKKMKPKPDAIDIHSKGIYYLPVWCVEGSNGLMIIDANSGKVIKEDLFKV